MLHRRVLTSKPTTPLKPIRIVIEDPQLAASRVPVTAPGSVDVRICSGPSGVDEICPLVIDGTCPVGPCDVVVCCLDGPWAAPVQAAWRDAGVTVTAARSSSEAGEPMLLGQLGAAYQALFAASLGQLPATGQPCETSMVFDPRFTNES